MDVHCGIPPGESKSASLLRKPYFRLRDGKPELAGWIVFEKGIVPCVNDIITSVTPKILNNIFEPPKLLTK